MQVLLRTNKERLIVCFVSSQEKCGSLIKKNNFFCWFGLFVERDNCIEAGIELCILKEILPFTYLGGKDTAKWMLHSIGIDGDGSHFS